MYSIVERLCKLVNEDNDYYLPILDFLIENTEDREYIFKLVTEICSEDIILRYLKKYNFNPVANPSLINSVTQFNYGLEIIQLLHQQGADVNVDNGQPLFNSIRKSNYEVTKYLLNNGAIVNDAHKQLLRNCYEFATEYSRLASLNKKEEKLHLQNAVQNYRYELKSEKIN